MESLLCNIISHIKESMPSLSMVDENYGQIENLCGGTEDNMYPVTFPAVLVDLQEVTWSHLKSYTQRGEARVNVQLVIDCYDDTHCGSGTMQTAIGRARMAKDLHLSLQGFKPGKEHEMRRESSKFYTVNHGIKIYETVYVVLVTDYWSPNKSPA